MIPKEILSLLEKAEGLGNHYKKNIEHVKRFYPRINELLSIDRMDKKVNFNNRSNKYRQEMGYLIHLSADQRTILDVLGCYFTLQLLWLNIDNIDWLDYQLSHTKYKNITYRRFILSAGKNFRSLTAAYMYHLIYLLKGDKEIPLYTITGVGTRSDQDDIDVGIIDDGSADRMELNRIIHRMSVEMMRFASYFHFHLSEHVGIESYSASIAEYQNHLESEIGNFVILTEMLGAALIIGDEELFRKFQDQVTSRYYYNGGENRFHEGYLRGILGEIMDLTTNLHDEDYLHPKNDGLRVIKNLIYAYKTKYNISDVNPWLILRKIRRKFSDFRNEFLILEKSLSFLEIFRYLYQQLVVQEELILVTDEIVRENLRRVALCLHYQDFGPYKSEYQLIHGYKTAIENYRKVIPIFIKDLTNHLRRNTVFNRLYQSKLSTNLFQELVIQLQFFRTVYFWDDFFDNLKESSEEFKLKFLESFLKLSPENKIKFLNRLIQWVGNKPGFVLKFCIAFKNVIDVYKENVDFNLLYYYLTEYENDIDFLQNLVTLFYKNPKLIIKVLQNCDLRTLQKLEKIIYQKQIAGYRAVYQKNLAALLNLIISCSYYFKRFITNIYDSYSGSDCLLLQSDVLEKEINQVKDHFSLSKIGEEKTKMLRYYYDLNFFKTGLETINVYPVQQINQNFADFSAYYFQNLYQLCIQKLRKINPFSVRSIKNLAIYACGGNGRQQAFDDDFDLIVISYSKSEDDIHLFREILALINIEMIKRGTLPHFRFIEHFGEYVCPFDDLKELILSDYQGNFIDKSQLLEAHLLVGNKNLHRKFQREIIENIIFKNGKEYTEQMIKEIYSRHKYETAVKHNCISIKECSGGLRDIEMIILVYKVICHYLDTNSYHLLEKFISRNKDFEEDWRNIRNALLFLQRFRYLYRLMVAAEDHIRKENLKHIALRMNEHLGNKTSLWEQFILHCKNAWRSTQKLIQNVP